jgi:hypothetical protein
VLQIHNTGSDAFTFTAGVVASLALRCPALAAVAGGGGRVRFDVAAPGAPPSVGVESVDPLPLDGERHVDRLFVGTGAKDGASGGGAGGGDAARPPPARPPSVDPFARSPAGLTLRTGDMRHEVEALPRRGFRDVGVRAVAPPPASPARTAAAAVVGEVARCVSLPPGGVFTGEAVFRLHDVSGGTDADAAAAARFVASHPLLRTQRGRDTDRPVDVLDEDPGAADEELEDEATRKWGE